MQESQDEFETHLDTPTDLTGKIQAVLKTPVPVGEKPEVIIARTQKLLRALGVNISSFAKGAGGPDGKGF